MFYPVALLSEEHYKQTHSESVKGVNDQNHTLVCSTHKNQLHSVTCAIRHEKVVSCFYAPQSVFTEGSTIMHVFWVIIVDY